MNEKMLEFIKRELQKVTGDEPTKELIDKIINEDDESND